MDEKVTWNGGMRFEGSAASGGKVTLGGGDDAGLKPTELVMIGLAGCTAMDVISILQKKQETVTAFEVSVQSSRREDHPRSFTGATVHYKVSGKDVKPESVARAVELSSTKYCSVSTTLEKAMPIGFTYSIHDEAGTLLHDGRLAEK